MKKAFKVTFIYIGVLLLAFIATVVFCGAFLFFYRDGNILGIQYIKRDQIIHAREAENMSLLKTIEINCKDFDLRVSVNPNVDSVRGAMRNKVFGYAFKKRAQANFTLEYDEVSKTAVFNAVEPEGWLSRKNCSIEVVIPKDLAEKGYNLKISTNKADIRVGGEETIALNNFEIKSNKGDAVITNTNISGKIGIDIGSGTMGFDYKCQTEGKIDCDIKLGSGIVNFTKVNPENFSLGTVEIISIKSGTVGIEKLKELYTDGQINSGGKIEIRNAESVDFSSLDTKVIINSLGKIGSGETSRLNFTGHGGCTINNVFCHLQVDGRSGDVSIKSATETISVITTEGNIKMKNVLKLVSASSEYGNIEILFDDAALDYVDTDVGGANLNRAVIASTKNGNILVRGLQNGRVAAGENGKVSLSYDRVVGENVIEVKNGSANIAVPNPTAQSGADEYAFNLTVDSIAASDIKVGVVGSIGAVDFSDSGFKYFEDIYGTAKTNNLKVFAEKGAIKIRSNDLVKY